MLWMFYFSGTGNARHVALWLASAWREHSRDAAVVDLAKADPRHIHIGAGDEVGIASPTHGFNFPRITLRFLVGLPRVPNGNRAFVVNTRGGVRFFGVYLPGLSGVAQLLAALVLVSKGYRVVGMRPVDLPSNWISIHPGLREDNVRAIYQRCAAITLCFAERLLEGRRDLRALWDLPQDLLIAPVSLGYYLVGRFFFAKSFIASGACDACGACIDQCPVRAIRLVDGRPFWSYRCESCMRCINQCPKRAIETAHGLVAGFLFLFYAGILALIYSALRPVAPVVSETGIAGTLTRFIFENALLLAGLFLSYRLLHRGLRVRVIERLTVVTSLTHFDFWRRYRPAKSVRAGTRESQAGEDVELRA